MTQSLTKVERIENKIDTNVTQALAVSGSAGGMAFRNMEEVMNFAKLMAISDVAVPPHIRENVGACLAVVIQAIEWRMSPYAVANKSYVVNNRLAFESQLVHAVIEQRAPITGRLRHRYVGEGDQRRYIVWATARGESEPLEYQSPEFGRIQPKNSPLWKAKPDLQLYYNASRDWARMYFPDVILGVYSEDELQDFSNTMKPATREAVPMPRATDAPPAKLSDAEAERIIQEKAKQARDAEAAKQRQLQGIVDGAGAGDEGGGDGSGDGAGQQDPQQQGTNDDPAEPDYPALPTPATPEWVAEQVALRHRPEYLTHEQAVKQVERFILTKLKVAWRTKMSRESQEDWYRRWMAGEFEWTRPPEAAVE